MFSGACDDMDFLNSLFVITSMMKIHAAYMYAENDSDVADFVVRVMIRDTDTNADGDYTKRNTGSGNSYPRCFPENAMIWIS